MAGSVASSRSGRRKDGAGERDERQVEGRRAGAEEGGYGSRRIDGAACRSPCGGLLSSSWRWGEPCGPGPNCSVPDT